MAKTPTTPNSTTNNEPEVESTDDSDLGVEFFEGFAADDSEFESAEASEPPSEEGSAEAASAAPAGGDAAAVPPAPVTPTNPDPAAPAAAASTDANATPATVPPADQAAAAAPAAAPKPEQQATPAQQTQDQQQPPTQTAGNEQQGDMLASVRAEVDKNRDTYTQLLAEKVYGLSEDDAKTLFEAPEKVLPNLAAKVHLEVVQNVLGTLAQILPSQIAAVQQVQSQQNALLDDFWNSHPTLDRKTDHQHVMQLARLYRAQNPNASFEEFKRVVGSQAMVMLNKLPVANAPVVQPTAPPATRAQAYRPAGQGTPPLAPTGQTSPNDFWAGFSEQLNE